MKPQTEASLPRKTNFDEWLKKKKQEEKAKRKKAQEMKAAAPKKDVIRLGEDLARFRASESGQAWKEERGNLQN